MQHGTKNVIVLNSFNFNSLWANDQLIYEAVGAPIKEADFISTQVRAGDCKVQVGRVRV
jgi:hypothetical protein